MPVETTPFGRVETHAWGSGDKTIVLLHAAAAGPRGFSALASRLAAEGWHCVAPALHGYGESRVEHADSVVAAHVAIARWAVETSGARAVFGHSMGGLSAILATPGLGLETLVLFEPILFAALDARADSALIAGETAMADAMASHLAAGRAEAAVRVFVETWNDASWPGLPENLRRRLAAQAERIVEETRAVGAAPIDPAVWSSLPPTTLLHGDRSPEIARRMISQAAARAPASRTVPLPGAGHMAPLMTADPVAEAVIAALP
jgi:pimeloyl-ACP methyl ester carboxylesterase